MREYSIAQLHEYILKSRHGDRSGSHVHPHTFKEYPRMRRIPLPESDTAATLSEAFKLRSSAKNPTSGSMVSITDIGNLLSGLQIRIDGSRPYPSGGALYPIETYLIGSIGEHANAVFHYHPQAHALEYLWPLPNDVMIRDLIIADDPAREAPQIMCLFAAQWNKNAPKYGEFGYLLGLIEAGHMAQNILLASAAVHTPSRPFAGINHELASRLLDLDTEQEQAVYSVAFWGNPQASVGKT